MNSSIFGLLLLAGNLHAAPAVADIDRMIAAVIRLGVGTLQFLGAKSESMPAKALNEQYHC